MTRPVRYVHLGPHEVRLEKGPDGASYVNCTAPLGPYPAKLTEKLDYWAEVAPERPFLAERAAGGGWRYLSFAEARRVGRSIGQALVDRGLSAERPIVILSGNGIDHARLALGALYAGVPFAPVSPAYSLISTDLAKLRFILQLVTPGMVFVDSGTKYRRAIEAAVPGGIEMVVAGDPLPGCTMLSDLAATEPGASLERAYAAVNGDTVAKFLFTSGSTGMPKAVINTQRMWCSNQQMLVDCLPFFAEEPPVLCNWLPWNHTAGGNHDFGIALYNGGTLYIDGGRPAPGGIEETVRNLREVATTFYSSVPKGYEELATHLRHDRQLRETFFSRLKLMWYAGANLSQHLWEELDALSLETTGERILMLTGYGSTETAPFAIAPRREVARAGVVGVPGPGMTLKLAPMAGKLEARVKGPNVTPGYWRQPELTRAAFDDEGFYKMGDALRFADENDANEGFIFDGRLAEDFKLDTGTWVNVGPLRAKFVAEGAPCVRDVVVAGHDREYLAVLILPDPDGCRGLCPELPRDAAMREVLSSPAVRRKFREVLEALAGKSTGSSNRIQRALLLEEPPSLDAHEVTDKGSINQRAVLANRAAMVEDLYAPEPPAHVISL